MDLGGQGSEEGGCEDGRMSRRMRQNVNNTFDPDHTCPGEAMGRVLASHWSIGWNEGIWEMSMIPTNAVFKCTIFNLGFQSESLVFAFSTEVIL